MENQHPRAEIIPTFKSEALFRVISPKSIIRIKIIGHAESDNGIQMIFSILFINLGTWSLQPLWFSHTSAWIIMERRRSRVSITAWFLWSRAWKLSLETFPYPIPPCTKNPYLLQISFPFHFPTSVTVFDWVS